MKKLKTIFSLLICLATLMVVPFSFVGCNESEISFDLEKKYQTGITPDYTPYKLTGSIYNNTENELNNVTVTIVVSLQNGDPDFTFSFELEKFYVGSNQIDEFVKLPQSGLWKKLITLTVSGTVEGTGEEVEYTAKPGLFSRV